MAIRHISPATIPKDKEDSRLTVVIPAAGMGRRMKSYGPKCLIDVGGISIIERQIRMIVSAYPNAEIILVSGFHSNQVRDKLKRKYPIRIVNNHRYEDTNVLYSISLGLQASLRNKVLIVYGDLVFDREAIRGFFGTESKVLVDHQDKFNEKEVGVLHNGNEVTNFSYGLEKKWGQIAFLCGREREFFEEIANKESTEKWFGYEALNHVLEQGGKLSPIERDGLSIVDVDSVRDIEKARKIILLSKGI